jgi:hypothetical protein
VGKAITLPGLKLSSSLTREGFSSLGTTPTTILILHSSHGNRTKDSEFMDIEHVQQRKCRQWRRAARPTRRS